MVQKSPLSRPDGFKFFKLKVHRHFWTLGILLSTLDILLSTLDILPSTLDILPSTLDPRQKSTLQFMKVHIGSDEKFSSGFFARFEFLHSLQVIFQFINTPSFLGNGKFFGGKLSFFGFSRVFPFPPAAMNGLFKFILVSVYLLLWNAKRDKNAKRRNIGSPSNIC